MRTLIIIIGGILLWGVFLGVSKLLGKTDPAKTKFVTFAFIALWFLISAGNMWMGVAEAGYTVAEELPVFILIFSLPAALALFVYWKFLRPGTDKIP